MESRSETRLDRRGFLAGMAMAGGALGLGGCAQLGALGGKPSLAKHRSNIGLQLYTVRDKFPTDFAGTMKAVAAIGYRHVQCTQNYGGLSLDRVKQILDENHLASEATHINPPAGAQFEPTLDAYARIGHKYTTVAMTGPAFPGNRKLTVEAVKRAADQLNAAGVITKKHGLKVIIHNHTEEFEPLADSPGQTPYDILIKETDPSLVALELDIGWATAAGADVLGLFKLAPGRFEVWHVKDMANLKALQGLSPIARHNAAKIVVLGQGEIDYRPIFAQADKAGMKNFYIEQDTAAESGDSLGAAAASYRYLETILV